MHQSACSQDLDIRKLLCGRCAREAAGAQAAGGGTYWKKTTSDLARVAELIASQALQHPSGTQQVSTTQDANAAYARLMFLECSFKCPPLTAARQ
jgi:hypothetical protein